MKLLLTYSDIDPQQWQSLVDTSPYATWFQTPEAYRFYAANAEEMTPFVFGVEAYPKSFPEGKDFDVEENLPSLQGRVGDRLVGVCVGYITRERSALKQFFTRRAIIIGGPLLAEDISEEALSALLNTVKSMPILNPSLKGRTSNTMQLSPFPLGEGRGEAYNSPSFRKGLGVGLPIYIETRNFHDYSKWRTVFEANGFAYQPHLNFHVDCTKENILANMSESRRRQIKKALKNGVEIAEAIFEEQVRDFYLILEDLYRNKVKTPLFPLSFFLAFYHQHLGKYLLVKYEDKIIGGIMCPILEGNTIYEWFVCGLDDEFKNQYPSVMATYAAIEYASTHKIALFDFMGAGKPDEAYGVRDFKARFGGEQVEHGRYLCVCKPLLYWIGKTGVKMLKRR